MSGRENISAATLIVVLKGKTAELNKFVYSQRVGPISWLVSQPWGPGTDGRETEPKGRKRGETSIY